MSLFAKCRLPRVGVTWCVSNPRTSPKKNTSMRPNFFFKEMLLVVRRDAVRCAGLAAHGLQSTGTRNDQQASNRHLCLRIATGGVLTGWLSSRAGGQAVLLHECGASEGRDRSSPRRWALQGLLWDQHVQHRGLQWMQLSRSTWDEHLWSKGPPPEHIFMSTQLVYTGIGSNIHPK